MKKLIIAALLASSAPAFAQNTLDNASTSGSDATAVSGSQSGSSSDNFNVNAGGNNAGIGNSESLSASDSTALSGSNSSSESSGNAQGQSQGANNDQGQSQGLQNTNSLGQQASNQQGVTVNQEWNTTSRKKTINEFRTNAAIPLAASSSFSSDYCGGTASGGVSAAPLGISIGGAGPTFDKSCQSLRRAEKFGMIAANYHNMGQEEAAMRAMSMMVWSVCTADSRGTRADVETVEACMAAGMLGSGASIPSVTYNQPQPAVTPEYTEQPNVQPLPENNRYKTPRGDLELPTAPGNPAQPALAAAQR